jgi:hypothetical protein
MVLMHAYKTNTLPKGYRQGMEGIHKWIKPLGQLVNDVLSLYLDLVSEESDNGVRSLAGLEAGGELMGEEICLCSSFIILQGTVED